MTTKRKCYHQYNNTPKKSGLLLGTKNMGKMRDSDGSIIWENSMECFREFKEGFKKANAKHSEANTKVTNLEEAEELRNKAKLENPRINISWFNKIETN
jgi:hypothetical protein